MRRELGNPLPRSWKVHLGYGANGTLSRGYCVSGGVSGGDVPGGASQVIQRAGEVADDAQGDEENRECEGLIVRGPDAAEQPEKRGLPGADAIGSDRKKHDQ